MIKGHFLLAVFLFGFSSSLFGVTQFGSKPAIKSEINLKDSEKTSLRAPLLNILKTTEWDLMLQEFELTFKLHTCKDPGLKDGLIGLKAHMIEPVGYAESTKKPLYFPFAELDLGSDSNIIKMSSIRNHSNDEGARDAFTHSHLLYVPLFGMIFKKKMKVFCFQSGEIGFPFISEFDPSYQYDLLGMKMIPHMLAMFSPQALVSGVIDCTAVSSLSAMSGRSATSGSFKRTMSGMEPSIRQADNSNPRPGSESDTFSDSLEDKLEFITNSMFWNVGCLGFAPVGGYVEGGDPASDTIMSTYGTLSKLFGLSTASPKPFFKKQTNFGMELTHTNGVQMIDTMCRPEKFLLPIKSQFLMQRAYPTVGTAIEFGSSQLQSVASNLPQSKDQYVFLLWERRDYAAFAYQCPSGGAGVPENEAGSQ